MFCAGQINVLSCNGPFGVDCDQYCPTTIADETARQECETAVVYADTAYSYYCSSRPEGEGCEIPEGRLAPELPHLFEGFPEEVKNWIAHIYFSAFGVSRLELAHSYNEVVAGRGLPEHRTTLTNPVPAYLPPGWDLAALRPAEATTAEEETEFYRPQGFVGPILRFGPDFLSIDSSVQGARPEGTDISPTQITLRWATEFTGAYVFDVNAFIESGISFIAAFSKGQTLEIDGRKDIYGDAVFDIDWVLKGGYILPISQRISLSFSGGLRLGYEFSNDTVVSNAGRLAEIGHFNVALGVGAEVILPLLDEPCKSNLPSALIGFFYWRALTSEDVRLSPDFLLFTAGIMFDINPKL